jgi:16S rRNA (guanine966-N2)-methyltransferase
MEAEGGVRISGGRLAGRRLRVPRSGARPTADRVRESLFGRLGDLAGRRVLDLFAGSGALGFEALSRGARHVTFVDRSNAALEVVRANASALGLAEQVALRRGEALAVLRRLAGETPFDLVFLDPPYADARLPRALAGLVAARLLAAEALVVAESDRRHPPGPIEGLAAIDERRYGDTLITWYVPAGRSPREAAGPEASDA